MFSTIKRGYIFGTIKRGYIFGAIKQRYALYRQRRDIRLLWPRLRAAMPEDIRSAREAFLIHAMYNSAWKNMSLSDILKIVDTLP